MEGGEIRTVPTDRERGREGGRGGTVMVELSSLGERAANIKQYLTQPAPPCLPPSSPLQGMSCAWILTWK